uniref:Large ribosomal subunit protein eL33 n=1 Tax=Oncopeltus fasciatus TaxID=7536 RepID=A3FK46_ONCFA|nr:ribosomal protein L35Ae [Oncopeltus fasciatus]
MTEKAPKEKAEKKPKEKAPKKVAKDAPKEDEGKVKKPSRMIRKLPGRLYAKAVFSGFQRGQRNQNENCALLSVEGCSTKTDSQFYVGKKCVFVYRGKNRTRVPGTLKRKTKVRAIWGKVTRTHGCSGAVRAKLKSNPPATAMGRRIRIMLYPSLI